jgi:hypothetical protein
MKIKIESKNENEIQAALAAVNGKALSFTITSYAQVEAYAAGVEDVVKKTKLPKKERLGIRAYITPAGPSAKSYKYASKSTGLTIEYGAAGWYLVRVASTDVFPRQPERIKITITQAQRDAIAKRAVADFIVAIPAPVKETTASIETFS